MSGNIRSEGEVLQGSRARAQVTEALLAEPGVARCAVVERIAANGTARLIAYVVPSRPNLRAALEARVSALPEGARPMIALVSALPRGRDGRPDVEALARVPVLDGELERRWDEAVRAVHPDAAGVTVQARPRAQPRIHVHDLAPAHSRVGDAPGRPESGAADPASGRPAQCEGEPLRLADDGPERLFDVLARAAALEPARGVLYVLRDGREVQESYADLAARAASVSTYLAAAGLQPGDAVLLQTDDDREFIAAFWGCVRGGFVPVPVPIAGEYTADNAGVHKLVAAWTLLGRAPVLASAGLPGPLRTLAAFEGELRLLAVDAALASAAAAPVHPARPDDLALLLMTSGSTGAPKLVQQTSASLIARATATSQMNGFGADEVSLNWFPLDHVGGLVMFHFQAIFDRCSQVQVATDHVLVEPTRWIDLLADHRVTVTWAPNFAFSLIADRAATLAARRRDLSRLWFVLNGGEAIVARQAHRFLEVLAPHGLRPTAMRPAWGMSETCSGVTFDHDFSARTAPDAAHTPVGRPVPGFAVRIVDAHQRVVREGEAGELEVRGPSVTRGYLHNDEANAASFTGDGWFRTGDLARVRDGSLTITGRQKDIIILHGANVSCHEIESAVEELAGVRRSFTAATAIRRPGASTDEIAVFFVPERDDDVDPTIDRIRRRVAESFGSAPAAIVPLTEAEVAKTSIGKIERGKLRARLEAGAWDELLRAIDLRQANSNTLPRWFHRPVFVPRPLDERGAADELAGRWLVLSAGALGAAIAAALRERGREVVEVEPGDGFLDHGAGRYTIAADDPADHARLVAVAGPIDHVVHAWLADAPPDANDELTREALQQAERLGPASLLALVQALAPRSPRRVALDVVTRALHDVHGRSRLAPAAGLTVGLLHTLGQECPWLRTRLLDLPAADDPGPTVAAVLRELAAPALDPVVVYAGEERRVLVLAAADLAAEPPAARLALVDGLVVITGGLGGVGVALAEHLIKRGARALLLLGRRALADDPVRRERLERLRAAADVTYAVADVCDADAVAAAIVAAEGRGAMLSAVFHLASGLSPGAAVEIDRAALHAALRAKVEGTRVLAAVLATRGDDRPLIVFASVNGTFGGAGYGAYASANSFQDSYTAALRRRGRPVHTLMWSMWLRTGMTSEHGDPELSRARGFHPMPADQALLGLDAALLRPAGSLYVGLDETSPSLAAWYEGEAEPLEELVAAVDDASGPSPLDTLELPDCFGAPTRVRRVAATRRVADDAGLVGEVAARVAAVWRQVLDLDQLDADSNFFDLGGHSLLIAQVQQGVEAALGLRIAAVELFRHPTLREFSAALALRLQAPNTTPAAGAASDARTAREQRTRAARRQRERRDQG